MVMKYNDIHIHQIRLDMKSGGQGCQWDMGIGRKQDRGTRQGDRLDRGIGGRGIGGTGG